MKKFDMISLEEAGKMAIEEDCIVVDLRGRKDYDVSHIENAINLPNASLKRD
ncbi:MAG: rhodanese-like domain-containing protein [Eubacterium ventriosum]